MSLIVKIHLCCLMLGRFTCLIMAIRTIGLRNTLDSARNREVGL
jgi:hypothetical protein